MPEHALHRLIDRLVLGRELPEVHRFKDAPYLVLGKRHRVLFHDPSAAALLALMLGPEAALSSLLHDLADRLLGAEPKRKRRPSPKAFGVVPWTTSSRSASRGSGRRARSSRR